MLDRGCRAPLLSLRVTRVGVLPEGTQPQPAYLLQQSQKEEVSGWEGTTQQTILGPSGRTSCLGAVSAGGRCPSPPQPQHNARFVALQRSREKEGPKEDTTVTS